MLVRIVHSVAKRLSVCELCNNRARHSVVCVVWLTFHESMHICVHGSETRSRSTDSVHDCPNELIVSRGDRSAVAVQQQPATEYRRWTEREREIREGSSRVQTTTDVIGLAGRPTGDGRATASPRAPPGMRRAHPAGPMCSAAAAARLYCFIDIRSPAVAPNGRHDNDVFEAAAAAGMLGAQHSAVCSNSISIRRCMVVCPVRAASRQPVILHQLTLRILRATENRRDALSLLSMFLAFSSPIEMSTTSLQLCS